MKKDQVIALLALAFFAVLVVVSLILVKNYGWTLVLGGLFIFVIVITLAWLLTKKLRFSRLLDKYGDEVVVRKIIGRTLWQGQTAEQVIDALGEPKDIDQKVLKTKTKEVWKYFPSGRRRYGLRVTLDNGEVVGWDDKL